MTRPEYRPAPPLLQNRNTVQLTSLFDATIREATRTNTDKETPCTSNFKTNGLQRAKHKPLRCSASRHSANKITTTICVHVIYSSFSSHGEGGLADTVIYVKLSDDKSPVGLASAPHECAPAAVSLTEWYYARAVITPNRARQHRSQKARPSGTTSCTSASRSRVDFLSRCSQTEKERKKE